jgi:hypothetical protein
MDDSWDNWDSINEEMEELVQEIFDMQFERDSYQEDYARMD